MRRRLTGVGLVVGSAVMVLGLTVGTAQADAACSYTSEGGTEQWYPVGDEIWIDDGTAYQVYRCTSNGWIWQATVDSLAT